MHPLSTKKSGPLKIFFLKKRLKSHNSCSTNSANIPQSLGCVLRHRMQCPPEDLSFQRDWGIKSLVLNSIRTGGKASALWTGVQKLLLLEFPHLYTY